MKSAPAERTPLSLYRKYRPTSFKEVRGQEHITAVLEAAVRQGKVAHAYLFAGSRGTGKTSTARILAKELKTAEEDIYEMDAASNRGIEEVRALREGVATLPFSSTYKFYIIDEAHALTRDAWGAFLKTLEEPPAHVIFVLATTELDKVPETITSRCQVFNFKKPSHEVLLSLVGDIAKREGASLLGAGAELIALMGEGSFRDTQGILQKVLTISADKKLTEEEVARVVGAPPTRRINEFIEALAERDIEKALRSFAQAREGGAGPRVFILLVVAKVRAILLARFAPGMKKEITVQFGPDDAAFVAELAGSKGAAVNSQVLAELLTALIETPRAPLPQIPLELTLYRLFGQE